MEFCLALVALTLGSAALGAETSVRPALVVVVSVDQLAYEYLERFQAGFADTGFFRRCERDGLWYANCHHRHAFTVTGPGHAVQLTGCYPGDCGIIDNDWYVRETGKSVYCVADPTANLIGTIDGDKPVSPRQLLAETLGDQLKLSSRGRSKVFGVAIKDRASILMVGKLGDAAFWMSNNGYWITSDYYRSDIPGYLRQINDARQVWSYAGKTWDLLLPRNKYQHGEQEDSFGERPVYGATADFPHRLAAADDKNYIKQVAGSPFGNEITLFAAKELLRAERLGADEFPDLLAINLSSNDYVGHVFGPESLEVEDMTYRTDLQLADFCDFVNRELGGRPWLLALTADHGVAPIPERAAKKRIPAKRNPLGAANSATGSLDEIGKPLEAHLRQELGLAGEMPDLVQFVADNQVYLRADHPVLRGNNRLIAERLTRDWLVRHEWIAAAVTREQLLGGVNTKLEQAFRRSFHPALSGDVLFALEPYCFQGSAGTTHGSPWTYDTHVPLLILPGGGCRLPAGRVATPASPAMLAPSLAELLRVPRPANCVEEALLEFSPQR